MTIYGGEEEYRHAFGLWWVKAIVAVAVGLCFWGPLWAVGPAVAAIWIAIIAGIFTSYGGRE